MGAVESEDAVKVVAHEFDRVQKRRACVTARMIASVEAPPARSRRSDEA